MRMKTKKQMKMKMKEGGERKRDWNETKRI